VLKEQVEFGSGLSGVEPRVGGTQQLQDLLECKTFPRCSDCGVSQQQGQRTLTPFDTKDLQQELPIPATGFAFHYEAHLPWMLLQQ